jgi:hypothetical protein
MMKLSSAIFLLFFIFFSLPFVKGAHFIVGIVEDAGDGTLANGREVVLWNPVNGVNDNLTDIVGPTGNSGANNIYLIDCELLDTPCAVGDELRADVILEGDGYISNFVSLTVTGAGFDIMPNLTLNSPPVFQSIEVDDSFAVPTKEIDLTPASTRDVVCEGVIYEYEGEDSLVNVSAEFYNIDESSYGGGDDNNFHYTNESCVLNLGYGDGNQVYFECGFNVEYYASSGAWNCTALAYDNVTASRTGTNDTNVNTLLALSVPSPVNFGTIDASGVSLESELNVTNVGNAEVNLSLSGYGSTIGDGLAMNCSQGGTSIPIYYEKFNLTASNPGAMTLSAMEGLYFNLTSDVNVREFNLVSRTDDLNPNTTEVNSTYWRIYVPPGTAGSCSGNIVFGAVQAAGS